MSDENTGTSAEQLQNVKLTKD